MTPVDSDHRSGPGSHGAGPSGPDRPPHGSAAPRDYARTERTIHLTFAFSLVCMVIVGLAAHRSVARLRDDNHWVRHSYNVLNRLEGLSNDVAVAQSDVRGYAISGSAATRSDYATDAQAVLDDLAAVRRLTADNSEQQRRVDALGKVLDRYFAYARSVLTTREQEGFDAARSLMAAQQGQGTRVAVRSMIEKMYEVESHLLGEREHQARRSALVTDAVIAGACVVALLFMGLATVAIRRDLTGRRRAEEELNQFFTLSLDFLTIAGADGRFKRVSPGVTEILGWTPEAFLAQPYLELVHPDDREATVAEANRQIQRGERVVHFENRYRHRDGSWRVLAWRSVPGPGGLMYGVARDVTDERCRRDEIRRLNADLQTRADQVEAMNAELEAFSYTVSHDLRAPLRHVQGYVEMLEHEVEGRLTPDGERFLRTIAASARKMNDLIDHLLAFAKSGQGVMEQTTIDVQELVAEVRHDLEMTLRGRRIDWTLAPIPLVRGNRPMLMQVVSNLLGNAVKYTRGRNPAEISIGEAGEENGRVVVFVRDNGVGFDMNQAGRLFGVFQRLHAAAEFEGSGVGLATVQRIVARHGGRVWAEAAPGAGATFYFTLPRALESDASTPGAV